MTDHLATFTAALGAAETPEAAQAALHRLADALIGAKLFTVMRVDMEAGLARRSYTSDAENYPGSGTKPIQQDSWFDVVNGRHELFVANTLADIARVFPDHELIGSLGCGSVINLPVLRGGALIGTVNMLDVEGNYTPERQSAALNQLTLPAIATLATVDALG
ncbi:GAF domain-containing protein [Oceaniglobus trochenteri]|uniref:GAF domain-containing protein n=1 Tax=Oceaniglobus trochenteri TaxID=2763260 RepID=UPI001CFFBA73|nr:GAF domain-containing protein [Oceaniglobus trochenteri]